MLIGKEIKKVETDEIATHYQTRLMFLDFNAKSYKVDTDLVAEFLPTRKSEPCLVISQNPAAPHLVTLLILELPVEPSRQFVANLSTLYSLR